MNDVVRAFLENEQKLRVVKALGEGGFGEVYEVESPSGVRSAVKVSLRRIDAGNPAIKKELENLNVVKAITGHPHIVTLMDYWLVADYLVTRWELASEGSLLKKLEAFQKQGQKGVPETLLLKWMLEAAEALDFLHSKGIYHRDIKPANLLLFHGHVKVADLGLAKVVGASTAPHTGWGTLGYFPPEAWQEHRLTPTVDLYGLAATYVKLRTGEEPFGCGVPEVFDRQRAGRPMVEGLRQSEAELVCRALAARPEDRPQKGAVAWVQQVHKALRARRQSGSSSPKSTWFRRVISTCHFSGQQPLVFSVLVLYLLVGLIWSFYLFRQQPGSSSPKLPTDFGADTTPTDTGASAGANAPGVLFALDGHSDGVTSACYSPDGRRTVTTSYDNTAIVWDAATGQKLLVLKGHDWAVFSAAYSPDGRRIVTASADNTAIVWDAATGQKLLVLEGHNWPVYSASYSPDSRRIVTASADRAAIVWDAETGQRLLLLKGHSSSVNSAFYSPDGRRIVAASADNTAIVWDDATDPELLVLTGHWNWVNSASYSPDGRHIVTTSADNTAIVWDAETGQRLMVLQGHGDPVLSVCYSPDGRRIVTASSDETAIVWDAITGQKLLVLKGHTNWVQSASYSPNSRRIVTASLDCRAIVWDVSGI